MRTDGRINIAIDVDGKEVEQGRQSVRGLEEDARKVKGGADQASGGIKNISASLALVKIGAAAFNVLANSMDAAISRFDTFQTFPGVMSALGESTEDSERAINKLSSGIDGLPTKLDDIVTVTQRMYASFGNLDESTDTALALNNALLASGASAADASRGTDQYIQGLQKGKFELEEWKTLQETMTIGLNQIAESFGMTERQLKVALDSGTISMDEFNDRMIELGTGSGALAELAKENSQTIATALTNLRNTASRGLADIIQAFSDMTEEVSGRSLYDNLESLKGVINNAFKAISDTIRSLAPVVITLVGAFQGLLGVAKSLEPVIYGLVAAYTALLVIQKVKSEIDKSRAAFELMGGTIQKITALTEAKTVAELANTSTQATYLAANMASLKGLTAKNVVLGLLTGQLKLSTAATLLKAKAVTVLNGVMTALSEGVGLVVAGIGLLVAGGTALVKWLNRSTEEGKKLAKQTEELGESTNELTGEVESNNKEYEKQIRRTEASAEANTDLAKKIGELSSQENLNSKQKKELQENIELLNNEVEGLNVAYDEEAKALNMSSEEMQKRIELMAEEEKYNAAKERQLEITKEQHEVDMQLKDVIALREHYHEQLENGDITKKEYKESVAELDEQEKALNDTLEILSVQYGVTEESMREAMENQHAVAKTVTGEQIILYEGLSEALQGTVDRMRESYQSLEEAATDAFNKIETETDHTMASMIETLEHNQAVVEEWAENQAKVIQWAGENGYESLVPYVESMTIDSAAELAVLADATDEEMTQFAEAMEEGGATAKDAFLEAHQMSEEDYNAVKHLVTGTKTALTEEIENADFASIGEDVTKGLVKGIETGEKEAVDATGQVADHMIEKTQDTLQTHSPSKVFQGIGDDVTAGLALGVIKGNNHVTGALKRLALMMPPIFDHMPGKFMQIGQQVMNGFSNGLASGSGAVLSRARSIANSVTTTIQSALKIQSPSRVMMEIGNQTGEGLAIGLSQSQQRIATATSRMANVITDISKDVTRSANRQIRELESNHNDEIKQMTQRHNEDIQSIKRKAKEDDRSLTKDEQIRIRRMTEDHNTRILEMEESLQLERLNIREGIGMEIVRLGQQHVDEQIWLGEMSAREEAIFWWELVREFERGSEEYEQALKNHQNVVANVRRDMESTHQKYADNISRIEQNLAQETQRLNENLINQSASIRERLTQDIERIEASYRQSVTNIRENLSQTLSNIQSNLEQSSAQVRQQLSNDIQQINEEYKQAHQNRVNELQSFTGLFERFQRRTAVPETGLIRNLQSQVDALEDYKSEMENLESKIDNQALLDELYSLGPDSLSELEALNRMSDDQLTEFVELYEQRFALASERATKELEPLKDETQKRIAEVTRVANAELSRLRVIARRESAAARRAAEEELEALKESTEEELKELNEIANEQLEELKTNTEETLKELNENAQKELNDLEAEWLKIVDDIILGTEKQFDRLIDIGKDAIKGLEAGMVSQESSLYNTANRIANNITRTIQSALQIQSPSKVMRDMVGRMIPLGIIEGIEAEATKVDQAMSRLAGNMMITSPELALGSNRLGASARIAPTMGNSITHSSNKSYNPVIHNHFTKEQSTPSEVARENKKQQQRLAMEWGY